MKIILGFMTRFFVLFFVLALLCPYQISGQNCRSQENREVMVISLEEVIDMARSNSLSSLMAEYSFVASYWQYRSYKAQFLPSLNFGASIANYKRTIVPLQDALTGNTNFVQMDNMNNALSIFVDQAIPWTGGKVSLTTSLGRFDQFSPVRNVNYNTTPVALSLSQPLFAYNSLKWQKLIEPQKYEKAKKVYLEDLETTSLSALRLFFALLISQNTLDLALSKLENTKVLYEIASERFKIGAYTKDQLLQMELQLLNAELAINKCRISLEKDMLALKSYLGIADEVIVKLLVPSYNPDLSVDIYDAVERALLNTSFSLENDINVITAKSQVAQAKANRGYSAVLSANFGLTQSAGNISDGYRNPIDQEIVGLQLSIPIVDWGLGSGQVKMAQSRLEIAQTQVEQNILDKQQEVIIEVMQFNAQQDQCRVALRANEIADERYDMAMQRFKNGTISISDINISQSEKDDASANYTMELFNYWLYYYTLRRSTLYDYMTEMDLDADFDKLVDSK
ncbi:MAG: TolC family protein [Candidatus Coprenecus sp.]